MKLARATGLLVGVVMAAVLVLLLNSSAAAQCSMCRASLAGSNALFIRNFNLGVLVLLVPPVAMFCSFFVVLHRHKLRDDVETEEESEPEAHQ